MKKNELWLRLIWKIWSSKIFKIMRLSIILLLIAVNCMWGSESYSQKTKLTLDFQNTKVSSVLDKIEDESEFFFLYSNKLVDVNRKVNISVNKKKIGHILNELFANTDVTYMVMNRQIVLSKKDYLAKTLDKLQQQIEVTGTVTDAQTGEPLPGVNIVVQGTTTGTTTDMDGEYSIEAPADATLVFSFVGYQEKTVEVDGREEINVSLRQAVTELEEVVAIGYGTQKRSDLTGSVASVETEEMESIPISSLNEGLQGKVAGAQITQSSGSPGSAVSMLIRGGNSILGGNQPLYVIDGMPVYPNNSDYSPGGESGFSSRVPLSVLSSINTNNIESIEVLKDASATAIYGNRGANGVVLITTESGKAGRNFIEFDASYGTQEIANKIDVPTGREFGRYLNLRAETLDEPQVFTQEQLNQLPTYDYQDLIMQTAATQSYNISLNGGTEAIQYSVSGNYKNQQGIVKNSAFERFSLRSKLTAQLSDNLEGGINVHGSRINKAFSLSEGSQEQAYSVIRKALQWPPIMPPFDEEGNYYAWDEIRASDVLPEGVNTSWELPKGENPVLLNNEHTDDQILDKLFGNLRLQYTILEGLSFETKAGVDITRSVRDEYWSRLTRYGQVSDIVGGSAGVMNVETTKLLNENLLRYNNEFGMHSINAVTGFTIEERIQEGRNMSASGFVTEITKTNDMGGGTQRPSVWSYKNRWGLMSYLGRINYTLKDRYLLTLTGRADGSSKFSEDNKWGFFPSAAVGWRITEEPFMKDMETISNLKLRLSWGVTGNQEIGPASALATYGSTSYSYGTNLAIGMAPGGVNNPSLEWEKTEQVNIGVDYAMFDNQLRLTADYYQKKTEKLLLDLPLPSSRAVGSIIQNAGALKNKGVEASLRGDIIGGEGFNWSSSVNFSHNKNEVTDLAGLSRVDAGRLSGAEEAHSVQIMEGYPVGIFYGLQADGIFKSEEEIRNYTTTVDGEEVIIQEGARPGALRIKDIDKDGEITMDDRTVIGDPYPDFTLGWNNQFEYGNFSLRVFLQGETGMDVYNVNDDQTARRMITDVWDPETNPDGKWPRPNADQGTVPGRPITSMDLQDASYIRLKNVTLGYNIPSDDVGFLRRARVYVTGKNLVTITDYQGYSPDVNSAVQSTFARGIEAGAYPTARIFTAGIKIGL
jgi:TonB-linked SusC/RagA family outer membrane protein